MTETRTPAGCEWLDADEWAYDRGWYGWVARDAYADAGDAEAIARRQITEAPGRLVLTPVLMREESEVEAAINGHEFPYYVECTSRARSPLPYWRVETASASPTPDQAKSDVVEAGD